MILIRSLLILLATGVSAEGAADAARQNCPEELVTFDAPRMEIRAALRNIADHAQMNIAVRTNVTGIVTTPTECVQPRVALRVLLSQVGAAFCEEGDVIRVSRSGRGCRGTLTLPPPNAYVAGPNDQQ